MRRVIFGVVLFLVILFLVALLVQAVQDSPEEGPTIVTEEG